MLKKYNKKDIEDKLQSLENELAANDEFEKLNIGIVGGSSLILKDVKSREVTKDIDAIKIIEFKENGIVYGDLNETMKKYSLFPLINSDFSIFESVLFVEQETEWDSVFIGEHEIVEAFTPSNETFVAMKLLALSGTKMRDPDLIDVTSEYILNNTDPKKVKELLEECSTYVNDDMSKSIFEQYEEWLKKYNENKDNS